MITEEEKDHLAIRIKHRGQCPYEKGHAESDFYSGGIFGAAMMFIIGLIVIFMLRLGTYH